MSFGSITSAGGSLEHESIGTDPGAPRGPEALLVTDDDAFARLEGDWASLLADTPLGSGFQSFAWARVCRAALPAAGRALFTIVVRDGAETIGIVPAEIDRAGALRLIGDRVSNYLGPLWRAGRIRDVAHAFAGMLAHTPIVRLIDFHGIRQGSPFLAVLPLLDDAGWRSLAPVRWAICPAVDLAGGWEALSGRRGRDFRSQLSRKWRALSRLGKLEFTEITDTEPARAALPMMFDLFRARWAGRRESGGFAGRYRSFHRRALPILADAGHLRLSLLTLDGEPIAFAYGVRSSGVTSSYVIAHDPTVNVASPGLLLLARLLEAACGRGDPEYDFSIGDEPYKNAWATRRRAVYRVLAWRRGTIGAARACATALGTRAWVAARAMPTVLALRREGLRHVLLGATPPDLLPDTPGLAAGHAAQWRVQRVAPPRAPTEDVTVRVWALADMRGTLSPRLLALAVDRTYRGDRLLAVYDRDQLLGIAWQPSASRRAAVVGGRPIEDTEALFYQPVASPDVGLDRLLDALAGSQPQANGFVVVTPADAPAIAGASVLGTFVADARFRSPTGARAVALPRDRGTAESRSDALPQR